MAKVQIDKQRCKGCYLCVAVCPKKSLQIQENLNKKGFRPVDFKKGSECIGCSFCALICPDCCIEIIKDEAKGNA
ncbi:MAG: 4Fe-4S dicluster domain-containing protein [Candidatus Omnitrophica bacterium]|jgi:2-oxoglutarate ferredoxin oxidoreductase subunit delta|nr:4Fe-4S dicluster domain-containing protein [Candidatus Omnitrophota bacterium]